MRKYSNRIEALLEMIPPQINALADIGADHGYFVCEAVSRGKVQSALAVENKEGPYLRLSQEVERQHLESKIEVLLSDGIASLPPHIPFVTIAGMGGETILEILHRHPEKLKNVTYLLIDAHSRLRDVRHEITNLGYRICQEIMIYEDGIYYELILFQKGNADYLEEDEWFGPLLRKEKSTLFLTKWRGQLQKKVLLLDEKLDIKRQEEIKKEIERIQKIL